MHNFMSFASLIQLEHRGKNCTSIVNMRFRSLARNSLPRVTTYRLTKRAWSLSKVVV